MSFRTIFVLLELIVTAQAFGTVGLPDPGPDVTILNSTPHNIGGYVIFNSTGSTLRQVFDIIEPADTWTTVPYRGDSLLTLIRAGYPTSQGPIECQHLEFASSASIHGGAFAVVMTPPYPAGCKVVRLGS
jgi:hypothetical protein